MNGTLVAAQVEGISTRADNTIKVSLGLQELSPSHAAELLGMRGKLVAVYISPKEVIPQGVIDQVDEADVDSPGKSQSQRIRSVLYLLFTQDAEGYKTFDEYYHIKTGKIIEHLKGKIK